MEKSANRRTTLWIIVAIVAVVILCCCLANALSYERISRIIKLDEIIRLVNRAPAAGVTEANYDRVEMGMTRHQVEAIFSSPGARVAAFDLGGETTEIYMWTGPDDAEVTITFRGGLVYDKDASGWE
jgi:hypothetical protein